MMPEQNNKPHRVMRYAVTREDIGSGMPIYDICYTFSADQAEEIAELLASEVNKRILKNVRYNVRQTGDEFDKIVERLQNKDDAELHSICDRVHIDEDEYFMDSWWWQNHKPYMTGDEDFTGEMKKADTD